MFRVKITPSGVEFESNQSEPILSSALKNSIVLEHSCSNGSCGACKAKVVEGATESIDPFELLTDEDRNNKVVLTCQAKCQSDILLEVEYFPQLAGIKRGITPAKVNEISFPSDDVAVIKFRTPPTSKFEYVEGQYLDLIVGSIRRSYSIANSVHKSGEIELHIRHVENGLMSQKVFNELSQNSLVRLDGPIGSFFVRDTGQRLVFICGGTGFAPVKAMVERLIAKGDKREIYIYWGSSSISGFYSELPAVWSKEVSNITYIPVLSGGEAWEGRTGLVHEAVLQDFPSFENVEVYSCGSPVMIDAAKRDFSVRGFDLANFHADAFVAS